MDKETLEKFIHLERIFMPYACEQREAARRLQGIENQPEQGLRFVHYTSAEAGLEILNSKKLWMRNTTCMSDYREVSHGYEILMRCLNERGEVRLCEALDSVTPGAGQQGIRHFKDLRQNNLHLSIFVASVSEHDKSEDQHGRLSMWRAFGNYPSRIAIVLRVPPAAAAIEALGITFTPVAYLTDDGARDIFEKVIGNIRNENEFLATIEPNLLIGLVFQMLFAGAAAMKHEGFKEEREWRVIYSPHLRKSDLIQEQRTVINGIPQYIQNLPLDGTSAPELDLANMIDEIIIGPSPYPWVIYQAFVEVLREMNVSGAPSRVKHSGIPIRS